MLPLGNIIKTNKYQIIMRVFHGSAVEVQVPEIRAGKFTKDFGEGFYCTKLKKQAKRWAIRKDTPTISTYNYTPNKNLSIKEFKKLTNEWLDFIVNCRNGVSHNYDIVIGAMANDQIYNYIEDFIDGVITREQFWVLAKFKYPTHQICFATEASLKCLTFVESEKISKK